MKSLLSQDESNNLYEPDYPDYFVDKHHPDDYKISKVPIQPESIYHKKTDHNRIMIRLSTQIGPEMFIPITFTCDTGAPSFLYLNKLSQRLLKSRIIVGDVGNEYIYIGEKRFLVKTPPELHGDINIIGLKALFAFGLWLNHETEQLCFTNLPNYI